MFGDPLLPMRFWAKVEMRPGPLETPCWIWTGCQVGKYAKDGRGYGGFWYSGKLWSAHILTYQTFVEAKPDDLVHDHLCDTPPCCNPEHIVITTNRKNVLRGTSPSATYARRTHCGYGHELTPDNLYVRKGGARRCKRCHNDDVIDRQRRQRRAARDRR